MKLVHLEDILRLAESRKTRKMVVAGQPGPQVMAAVLKSRELGLTEPVGWEKRDPLVTREQAFEMIGRGTGEILLDTGPLSPDFFSRIAATDPLRKTTISYVSVFDTPTGDRLTLLTDVLVQTTPDLNVKIAMMQNAVAVAEAMGVEKPRVAALAPLELINPTIQSTVDAAVLSKMSRRGQFGDARVEGPLAMDNAESAIAARQKGIESDVPGNVDVYFFPDIESANITAQFLSWVFQFGFAGILAGAAVPVVVQSPIERDDSWLINIALAVLMCG
jgi:phosphotransacetylase